MSVFYGVESHLQVTWAVMKDDKYLYTLFQRKNTKNKDYMKEFEDYINVIELYGGKAPIHPASLKASLPRHNLWITKTQPNKKMSTQKNMARKNNKHVLCLMGQTKSVLGP